MSDAERLQPHPGPFGIDRAASRLPSLVEKASGGARALGVPCTDVDLAGGVGISMYIAARVTHFAAI